MYVDLRAEASAGMRWAEAIRALGASPCRENDDVRASLLHEASDLGGYTGAA